MAQDLDSTHKLRIRCSDQTDRGECQSGFCEWDSPQTGRWRSMVPNFLIRSFSSRRPCRFPRPGDLIPARWLDELRLATDQALGEKQWQDLRVLRDNLLEAGWMPWWLDLAKLIYSRPHLHLLYRHEMTPHVDRRWLIWNLAAAFLLLERHAEAQSQSNLQEELPSLTFYSKVLTNEFEEQGLRGLLLDFTFDEPLFDFNSNSFFDYLEALGGRWNLGRGISHHQQR